MTSIGVVAAELGLPGGSAALLRASRPVTPARDPGGRRDYSPFDIEQLRLVTGFRAVGIPIKSIRQLLSAKVRCAPSRANAERARDQLGAIDAVLRGRQAEIRAARRLIRTWVAEIEDWPAGETSEQIV